MSDKRCQVLMRAVLPLVLLAATPSLAAETATLPSRPDVALAISLTRLRTPVLQLSAEISGVLHRRLSFGGGGFWGHATVQEPDFIFGVDGAQSLTGLDADLAGGHLSGQWTLLGTPTTGLRAGLWLGYAQLRQGEHAWYTTQDRSLWYATPTVGGRWTAGPMLVMAHVGYGPGWSNTTTRCCGAPSRSLAEWRGVLSGSLDLGVAF